MSEEMEKLTPDMTDPEEIDTPAEEEAPEAETVPLEDTDPAKRPGRELFEWLQMILGCILAAVVIFNCFARLTRVDGTSMDNTLEHGEMMLVWSLGYTPKQGDIVVVNKTTAPFTGWDGKKAIVKRVIATEGQTVDIDFEAGIVYVDGEALQEDYTYTPTNVQEGMTFPLTLQDGCVFAMGDNRNGSLDSRCPDIGQIDRREILGKALFLFLPGTDEGHTGPDFERIGAIK